MVQHVATVGQLTDFNFGHGLETFMVLCQGEFAFPPKRYAVVGGFYHERWRTNAGMDGQDMSLIHI